MNSPALPRWRVFPALALGTVMATLDISVVNLALPSIARDFHAPLTTVTWVVLAYVLVITGLLLALGRLADRTGRRSMYGTGLLVFIGSSALCGAAGGAAWLIASRALQGLGAAMMSANSTALLVAAFPERERGRALGAFGASVGVGLAAGPPLGGWVVAAFSWRWLFLLNLPLGVLAFLLLRATVAPDTRARTGPPLDFGSAMIGSVGLVLLMVSLSFGPERGWAAPVVLGTAAGAAGALAIFGVIEGRASDPLLPWAMIRGPLGPAALLTFIGQALSISVAFLLPIYLEGVRGLDAAHAGAWLAVLPVAALLCAPLAGQIADRLGPRPPSVVGLVLAAAGDLVFGGLGLSGRGLLSGAVLLGVGLGLFTVPNASNVMGAVPPSLLGTASGLQGTMRNLGIASGTAAAAATVASLYARAAHMPLLGGTGIGGADRHALALAVGGAFAALGGLAIAGAALAAFAPPAARSHAVTD